MKWKLPSTRIIDLKALQNLDLELIYLPKLWFPTKLVGGSKISGEETRKMELWEVHTRINDKWQNR